MMGAAEPDEEEQEETSSSLNATLHREYWGRHFSSDGRLRRCIVVCRSDDPRPPQRCPCCFGRALSVPQYEALLTPVPGLGERSARWLASWIASFWDALTYPFRRDTEQIKALLGELLAAGMRAELVEVCPQCQSAKGEGEA
jgi:hypothetical protein